MIDILLPLNLEKKDFESRNVKRNSCTKNSLNIAPHYNNSRSNTIRIKVKYIQRKKIVSCLLCWTSLAWAEKICMNGFARKLENLLYSDSTGFSCRERVWKFKDVVL